MGLVKLYKGNYFMFGNFNPDFLDNRDSYTPRGLWDHIMEDLVIGDPFRQWDNPGDFWSGYSYPHRTRLWKC